MLGFHRRYDGESGVRMSGGTEHGTDENGFRKYFNELVSSGRLCYRCSKGMTVYRRIFNFII